MNGNGGNQDDPKRAHARRRLLWFGVHILIFVAIMIVLVGVSISMNSQEPWFVFPLVAWGAPLALLRLGIAVGHHRGRRQQLAVEAESFLKWATFALRHRPSTLVCKAPLLWRSSQRTRRQTLGAPSCAQRLGALTTGTP